MPRYWQTNYPNHKHQADLILCNKVSLKTYFGYNNILTVIDVYSRKGVAIPLKTKDAKSIIAGFKEVYKILEPPKMLDTDAGTEFTNHEFNRFLRRKGIKHKVSVFPPHVERFNLTLIGDDAN